MSRRFELHNWFEDSLRRKTRHAGRHLSEWDGPSKALLHNSHLYAEAAHEFKDRGIEVGQVKLNLKKLMANKDEIVGDLTKGIEFLFKKNKAHYLQGTGSIEKARWLSSPSAKRSRLTRLRTS